MNNNLFKISVVTEKETEEVVQYVLEARKILFPMLDAQKPPKDLVNFAQTYVFSDENAFFQLRNQKNQLIGAIGMLKYDYRFDYLRLPPENVSEIVRLYIDPAYRRAKLATKMVNFLEDYALKHTKINHLYLHTHPFLSGACEFWLNQGFGLIAQENEGNMETLHFEKKI